MIFPKASASGLALCAFIFLLSTSCSHTHVSSSVIHAEPDGTAHVCLDSELLKIGDVVEIYNVACSNEMKGTVRRPTYGTVCERQHAGQARVVEKNDEHFSQIRPIGDLKLKIGQIVQKK